MNQPTNNSPGTSERTSVLIVEDDPIAANSLRYLLEHYGYRALVASGVKQAIQLLDTEPQIILLDLNLPDGDGVAVMQALRNRKMTTRVAVVSAVIDHDRLQRIRSLKPEMVLSKPLNFLSLLAELRSPAA